MHIEQSLDAAEAAKYPILMAPFFNSEIPVMVRELSHIDCQSIGDFSMINDFHGAIKDGKISLRKMREYVLLQHKIVEASLVKPSYKDLISVVTSYEKINEIKERLKELDEMAAKLKAGPARSKLEDEISILEIKINMPLPPEFTAFIEGYALGYSKTDIKKVSEDILRNAAVMAELGNDNPADHIGGRFERWPGDKLFVEDINRRARILRALDKEAERDNHGR
jgi:hypothetical protein